MMMALIKKDIFFFPFSSFLLQYLCLAVKEEILMNIYNASRSFKSGLKFSNIVWNGTGFEEFKVAFEQ